MHEALSDAIAPTGDPELKVALYRPTVLATTLETVTVPGGKGSALNGVVCKIERVNHEIVIFESSDSISNSAGPAPAQFGAEWISHGSTSSVSVKPIDGGWFLAKSVGT